MFNSVTEGEVELGMIHGPLPEVTQMTAEGTTTPHLTEEGWRAATGVHSSLLC